MNRTHRFFSKSKFFVSVESKFAHDFSVEILLSTSLSGNSTARIISRKIATKALPFFRLVFYANSNSTRIEFVHGCHRSSYNVSYLLPFKKIHIADHLSIVVSKRIPGATFIRWNGKIPTILSSSFIYLKCPFCTIKSYFAVFQSIEQLQMHSKLFHGDHFRYKLLYRSTSIYVYEIRENRDLVGAMKLLSRTFAINTDDFSLAPLPFSFKYQRKSSRFELRPKHQSEEKKRQFQTGYNRGARYFVDSFLMQPLDPAKFTSSTTTDSEAIIDEALIRDFCDLSEQEKSIMICWNNFQRQM